jgi:excisionase family DNA binding protein
MRLPIHSDRRLDVADWVSSAGDGRRGCRLLRIGRTTAYELVMSGKLQSVKVGRRRLVVRDGVRRYVE